MNIKQTEIYVGCTKIQVDKVRAMVEKGRQYFGSSGASLTHQVHDPKYKNTEMNPVLAKAGLEGEHNTTALLKQWLKDKPEVIVVDSVHVKGYGKEEFNEETGTFEGGDTDHILIIGDTVIIIDSKNWKGRRKYVINEDGEVTRGGQTFPGGRLNIVKAAQLWASYLSPHRASVSSIVTITSDKVFVVRDVNWWKRPYRLVTNENLIEFLDNVWMKLPNSTKGYINVNLIASIAANAIKPYDPIKELLGETTSLLKI